MYTLVQLKSKYHLTYKSNFVKDGVANDNRPLRYRGDIEDRDGHIVRDNSLSISDELKNYVISDDHRCGISLGINHKIVAVYHNTTTIPDVFKSPDYIITDDENDKDPRSIYVPVDENRPVQNLDKLIQERRMINHNLDKTQIKLLMNYDMEHVLVALDKAFTAKNKVEEGNSKVEFLNNKVRELTEMLNEFQAKFTQKAAI